MSRQQRIYESYKVLKKEEQPKQPAIMLPFSLVDSSNFCFLIGKALLMLPAIFVLDNPLT